MHTCAAIHASVHIALRSMGLDHLRLGLLVAVQVMMSPYRLPAADATERSALYSLTWTLYVAQFFLIPNLEGAAQ